MTRPPKSSPNVKLIKTIWSSLKNPIFRDDYKDYQMSYRNETSRSPAITASTADLNCTEIPVELHTDFAADHEVLLA